MKSLCLSLLLVAIFPLVGFAHAGHGHFGGHQLMHFLSSPLHLIPVLALLAIALYWAAKRYYRTYR